MNDMTRPALPPMTRDEFLAWPGDGTRRKFHLMDGVACPMSPAGWVHGTIQANLAAMLGTATLTVLHGLNVVAEGAIVPAFGADGNVRVPDLVVTRHTASIGTVVVPDPLLIVEILSPGNAPATRDNVRAYATLTTVREIAVVSTSRMEVELIRRGDDGAWREAVVIGPGGTLELETAGLSAPISAVYARTSLASPSSSS